MKLILYCFRHRLNDGSRLLGIGMVIAEEEALLSTTKGSIRMDLS